MLNKELSGGNINKRPREVTEAEHQTVLEDLNVAEDLAMGKHTDPEQVKPDLLTVGAQLSSSFKRPITNNSVQLGISSKIHKDKYSRRRVSAVRDFPPFCGPNASWPTQHEHHMSNLGKDSMNAIEKLKMEMNTTQILRKNLDRGESRENPVMSHSEYSGGVEKVEVRKKAAESSSGTSRENARKEPFFWRHMTKAVAKKSKFKRQISGGPSLKKTIPVSSRRDPDAVILGNEKNCGADCEYLHSKSLASHKPHDVDIPLPPKSLNQSDARSRVIKTLKLFHFICRKHLQEATEDQYKRVNLVAAWAIKEMKIGINMGKQILGEVPGVEVGDEFQYRVELSIVGIHCLYQNGIDTMKHNGVLVANSIVEAGIYEGDKHYSDVLIYSGQGGNVYGKNKRPEDQKLVRGNLALKNSISAKTPVRVIRGWKETNRSGKIVTGYVYDGLYTVERYWEKTGTHGKLVFMFELRRNPGQPKLRKN